MDNLMKAVRFAYPERIPVRVGLMPATWAKYGQALQDLCKQYPAIFDVSNLEAQAASKPPSYHAGSFTDAWGCVWENIADGYESIVTGHPLKTREDVRRLKPPEVDIGLPHGFMFLRLTDLRGFEEMMVDFAEEPPELQMLVDRVRDYNVRQVERFAPQAGEIMYFGDDNGMQASLPISPATWRKYLKPCYAAIFGLAKALGKTVYFHTDGCIHPVIPDMVEAGADIINPQIRANGLANLVDTCKGKVCIDLDLDRQLFPFATPQALEAHIWECVQALYLPQGGLMLYAECAADVPMANIEAICHTLAAVSTYRGQGDNRLSS